MTTMTNPADFDALRNRMVAALRDQSVGLEETMTRIDLFFTYLRDHWDVCYVLKPVLDDAMRGEGESPAFINRYIHSCWKSLPDWQPCDASD